MASLHSLRYCDGHLTRLIGAVHCSDCFRLSAQVAKMGSVRVEALMEVERYSHVMHLSSTVTGDLLPQLDAWDVLRAALPAGTVSGAPKVGCWVSGLPGF